MSGHAGWNSGRSDFIVKGRGRYQYTLHTRKGPRRVWRWEPWKGYQYCSTLGEADNALPRLKKAHGLTEFAIFHKGKQVTGASQGESAND